MYGDKRRISIMLIIYVIEGPRDIIENCLEKKAYLDKISEAMAPNGSSIITF